MNLNEAKLDYKRFTMKMRGNGWSADDVKEYADHIAILFGKDEKAALSLYPAGHYHNAKEARQDAVNFWKSV